MNVAVLLKFRHIFRGRSYIVKHFSPSRPSSPRSMALSEFLNNNKQRYLEAVRDGKGREWVVVMGNEAGDLDSIASSIAYSWFASTVKKNPTIALLQTAREDIKLRPENVYAFSLASITPDYRELLCNNDVPPPAPFPSNRFALVDHNHLLPRYSEDNEDVRVVAIIDHHDDEGLYKDTADPRTIVVPTGSCTSLVAKHISSAGKIPPEIATLLVCGILVDTEGLKPGGKAEQIDYESAAFLLPKSTLATSDSFSTAAASSSDVHDHSAVRSLAKDLLEKKFSVAHLSTRDLLRRDYKQYAIPSSWTSDKRAIQVGLATVPVGLKPWISRSVSEFWESSDQFMDERGLDVLGILTSFQSEPKEHKKGKDKGNEKVKHKRQILFVVREISDGGLEERIWAGLENAEELKLERRPIQKYAGQSGKDSDGGAGERKTRAYKQGNTKATRKKIAPLVRSIIEGGQE